MWGCPQASSGLLPEFAVEKSGLHFILMPIRISTTFVFGWKKFYVRALCPGQIIIMDNAKFHKSEPENH
jgi:hypothetical protein